MLRLARLASPICDWPAAIKIRSSRKTAPHERMTRILLLSAYRSDSHAAWTDWLLGHIENVEWTVRELPGRHFAWRIRGNPLSWLDAIPAEPPDLVLASSMVDLATLRGLQPQLVGVPAAYYFHENQFAYPVSDRQFRTIEPAVVQLYGALAADQLLFNSGYNQASFLDGVAEFAARMPDRVPGNLTSRLAAKCQRLPVPVEPVPPASKRDPRLIVWNHRWEYDKRPELFAEALCRLADQGVGFRLALLGKRPRQTPPALRRIREQLAERIVVDARLPVERYRAVLGRAGIAVSTAIHEFQGLGMLEAASAGALPLVPDGLCYVEQYPDPCRYPAGEVEALVGTLAAWLEGKRPAPVDIGRWLAPALAPHWARWLSASAGTIRST